MHGQVYIVFPKKGKVKIGCANILGIQLRNVETDDVLV